MCSEKASHHHPPFVWCFRSHVSCLHSERDASVRHLLLQTDFIYGYLRFMRLGAESKLTCLSSLCRAAGCQVDFNCVPAQDIYASISCF